MTGPFFDNNNTGSFSVNAMQALADEFGTTIHNLVTHLQDIPLNDLIQVLKYLHNDARGVNRTAAISKADLQEIENIAKDMVNGVKHATRDYATHMNRVMVSTINNINNQITTLQNNLKQSNQQYGQRSPQSRQIRDEIDRLKNNANNILTAFNTTQTQANKYNNFTQQLTNQINLYQQKLNEDTQAFNNLGMFGKVMWNLRDMSGLGDQMFRGLYRQGISQFGYNPLNARAYASDEMRRLGWVSAKYLDPDYDPNEPNGGPGGSASRRTESDRFINRLVGALMNTPFAKKISTLAQDGALALTLAFASKAPPWLQSTIMGAVALGLPQGIMQVAGTILSDVISRAITRSLIRNGTLRLIENLLPRLGTSLLRFGLPLLVGWATVKAILGIVGKIFDVLPYMSDKEKEGKKAFIGGATGVSLLGGAIASALVGGPIPLTLGLIAGGITAIKYMFDHFQNWRKLKDTEEHPIITFLKGFWPFNTSNSGSGEGHGENDYIWHGSNGIETTATDLLGHKITSGFGGRIHPTTGSKMDGKWHQHTGVDLAYKLNEAVAPKIGGTVTGIEKGWNGGYGNTVYVTDQFGVIHQYSHLNKIGENIQIGTQVGKGSTIGYAGKTGYATGVHVHYQTMKGGMGNKYAIDPVAYQEEYEEKVKLKNTDVGISSKGLTAPTSIKDMVPLINSISNTIQAGNQAYKTETQGIATAGANMCVPRNKL